MRRSGRDLADGQCWNGGTVGRGWGQPAARYGANCGEKEHRGIHGQGDDEFRGILREKGRDRVEESTRVGRLSFGVRRCSSGAMPAGNKTAIEVYGRIALVLHKEAGGWKIEQEVWQSAAKP